MNNKLKSQHRYLPSIVEDLNDHSMGKPLLRYLDIKMHHLIDEREYDEIVVLGEYDRTCVISKKEKDGKTINWQRPTAEISNDVLYVKCFPGFDYVMHYACMISSYLSLKGRKSDHVSYVLPSDDTCWDALPSRLFSNIPNGDIAIIGWGLPEISQIYTWQGNQQVLWAEKVVNQQRVVYIIFQHSYWGDIIERVTVRLAEKGFDRIIFTAKVGGISETDIPNKTLLTGDNSFLNGRHIKIDKNIFRDLTYKNLRYANHFNSPSVMLENHRWIDCFSQHFDAVDSEIGYFLKAGHDMKIEVGYLHYVSNNLLFDTGENLSNEREPTVLLKREKVKESIRKIIDDTI